MTPKKPSPKQLEQLFQDMEDGTISADDHSWLMSLFRHDADVRKAYWRDHMILASGLHELAEYWGSQQEDATPEPAEIRQRRSWRQSFLTAAAVVALLAIIGSLISIHGGPLPPAVATSGVDSVWRFERGGIDDGGNIIPSTQIIVDKGTVQISTRHRTRMLIEGPAVFNIHGPDKTTLIQGKAWFDVSEKDKGFTVMTDRVRVIDLGTRFGVAATAASDRIQVDSGKVRVESKYPGISASELIKGMATESNLVGRTEPVSFDPDFFLRELPRKLVSIHWSFDELLDGEFPAQANGISAEPLRMKYFDGKDARPKITAGRFGAALDLTNSSVFAESNFAGISGSGPRTIAIWFKGAPIKRRISIYGAEYTPPLVLWGNEMENGASWSLKAHCDSGIFGSQWAENGYKTAGKIGEDNIHDGKWHHLVAVYTGTEDKRDGSPDIRHYIDGERVTTATIRQANPIDTECDSAESHGLRIAYDMLRPAGPGGVPVMIDELHIVRSALDDDRVRSLYLSNQLESEAD